MRSESELIASIGKKLQDLAITAHHRHAYAMQLRERNMADFETAKTAFVRSHTARVETANRVFLQTLETTEREFRRINDSGYAALPWRSGSWSTWAPSGDALREGRLEVQLGDFHIPTKLHPTLIPLTLPIIGGTNLVVHPDPAHKPEASALLQSIVLRLLAALPPGNLMMTFLDPVGLGQNAAPFMQLADESPLMVNSRAWSEPNHIEERLTELTEHMGNVIQTYLRNDFNTIAEYNIQANDIAEPYRVLVAFDFPAGFSEVAARRLVSIAQNGPRCGVHVLLVSDTSKPQPYGFSYTDLEQYSHTIAWRNAMWSLQDPDFGKYALKLDSMPPPELCNRIVKTVGLEARKATRVQVPFDRIAPVSRDRWRGDSTNKLTVALGPSGARKVQMLELGVGTAHHALVVGRTGSGKSTLLHTLINCLALTYDPSEVEMYLIDFKEGVEFLPYARADIPHVPVVAIESEREFGVSVLQGLADQFRERSRLFKSVSEENYAGYRKTGGKLPRILLLVDEFQVFFSEEDALSTRAMSLLDQLVRQGRSAGIHLLLATQSLAGVSLPRSTMDQIGVRIALQCSENDSRLILADDNPAARLLTRPGEAVYNSANGRVEGNYPFQVAYLDDTARELALADITSLSTARRWQNKNEKVVFEGNASADFADNPFVGQRATRSSEVAALPCTHLWLGKPIAIRDHVAAPLRRQSGANLLIISQDEAVAHGLLHAALAGLSAQPRAGSAQVFVLDLSFQNDEGSSSYVQRLSDRLGFVRYGRRRHIGSYLDEVLAELNTRLEADDATRPLILLCIHGLHRARDLRPDEAAGFSFGAEAQEATLAQKFGQILKDGPELGIHTIVWCDTASNLNRSLDRRHLSEFAMRVVTQMGAEDSSVLIDSPIAAKLGPKRAAFYSEDEGRLEKFIPYSA